MILINGFHYNSTCAVVSACICSLSYCHESLNKSIQLVTLKKILTGKLFHKISWHKIIFRGKLLVLSVTLIHIHHTDKCLCLQFSWSLETLCGEFWELSYKCNILKLGYKYFTSLLRNEKSEWAICVRKAGRTWGLCEDFFPFYKVASYICSS